jgi:HEAT repeat protein
MRPDARRARWLAWLVLLVSCDLEREHAIKALASPDAPTRAEGVRRLGESGDPATAELVAPLLKDPSARVRRNVVAALGALGPQRRLPQLVERLQDADLEVRLAVVRVLGDSKSVRARAALLPSLEDASMIVRRAASLALLSLGLSRQAQVQELAKEQLADQIKRLRHADDQHRAAAARMVGLSGRGDGVKPLLERLGDRSPLVQRAVSEALGRLGGEHAQEALARLARSRDPSERSAAAVGLAQLADNGDRPLRELLGDRTSSVRRAVLLELSRGAASRVVRWTPQVCAALLDREAEVGIAAARLVGRHRLGCASTVDQLLRAMGQGRAAPTALLAPLPGASAVLLQAARQQLERYRDESVRWISPERWKEIAEDPSPEPPLAVSPSPKRIPDPGKRAALARLLARFPERRADEPVEDPLLPPRTDEAGLLELLAALGGRPEARRWLASVASAAPPVVRAAALRALAVSLPSPTSGAASSHPAPASRPTASQEPVDPLARAVWLGLRAGRASVRRAAAEGCPLLGLQARGVALELLRDRDFELRAGGARCLGELKDASAVKPLLQQLREEPQAAVIEALAQIGDHRATAPLVELLREDHPADRQGERIAIIAALGALGDRASSAALERELAHPDAEVRRAAAEALARAGQASSCEALTICLADYYADVRAACQRTLLLRREPRR